MSVAKRWLYSIISLACLGAAIALAVHLTALRPRLRNGAGELIYLPSPGQVKLFALGFDTLLADYYWVSSLQYFMDPAHAPNDYRNLADYIELIIGLDPDFKYAYKFAGITVPYDQAKSKYKNADRAIPILQRAEAKYPNDWNFPFLLGFCQLYYMNNPEEAAKEFARAATLPEAPRYLGLLAARVYAVAGRLDGAIEFTREALNNATDPEFRQLMKGRLEQLMQEKELRAIEAYANRFKAQQGRWPHDLEELSQWAHLPNPGEGFSIDLEGHAHGPIATDRMVLHRIEDMGH